MNFKDSFLIKSFNLIHEFSSVDRFNKHKLIIPENDLEHTGFVCLWGYLLAQRLEQDLHIEIDYSQLLKGAVIHDIDEVLTGDVQNPTKYFSEKLRKEMKLLESASLNNINKYLDYDTKKNFLKEDWENAKGVETLEKYIVTVCDLMSVVYKVWQEIVLFGNLSFIGVSEEVQKGVAFFINYGYQNLPFVKDKETLEAYHLIDDLLAEAFKILEEAHINRHLFLPKPLSLI